MTTKELLAYVRKLISTSELIKIIQDSRKIKNKARASLTQEQIERLKANGNVASDWKKIKVSKGLNVNRIKNCTFYGEVTIGEFNTKVDVGDGIKLPAGLYNSTIANTNIGDNVLIRDVSYISNYIVADHAILFNNGIISHKSGKGFGNGSELPIAIESGGREVKVFAEITVDIAEKVATSRADKQFLKDYSSMVDRYISKLDANKGVIAQGAVVKNTKKIVNTFIGPYAVIDNAVMVMDSTILSNEEERSEISDGAFVKSSLIQWGCEVTSMAILANSVLVEHSHIERHGKVTDSIIGANTGVAEGEVTASLVGPFVGFHHQALLIAAFWPEGKGNVGYGANVGSNHTSKAPDQELWPGEGTFFGLGVNIKFPSDFTKAPYSIIATGVNALPQKITFPFSLINSPAERFDGISPAYNEIMPGWVLSDNIFTIRRNEGKYKKRDKSKRSKIVYEVFRPEIVDLMLDARERLKNITEQKDVYTEKDISGIGKNYLKEASRKAGIDAYTFYIRYYALMGLKRKLKTVKGKNKVKNILHNPTDDSRWEHERKLLLAEFPENTLEDNLTLLIRMQEQIAESVRLSKEKDDKRGARIISDYMEAHTPASEDSFVKQTMQETQQLRKEVETLLKLCSGRNAKPDCKVS